MLLFFTEANLLDEFELVECDPNSEDFEQQRSELASLLNKSASFPTAVFAGERAMPDSDALIDYFAHEYGVEISALPTLAFYKRGIMPAMAGMFKRGFNSLVQWLVLSQT